MVLAISKLKFFHLNESKLEKEKKKKKIFFLLFIYRSQEKILTGSVWTTASVRRPATVAKR